MLGRFLEISLSTEDIQTSLAFYEDLGFRQVSVGETWSHPYAVITDGHLVIGIHQYEFASPSLTYVRPDLAQHVRELEALGVAFKFRKLADDEFNEAGFLDPNGQMITLLEARTYSPFSGTREDFSALGRFVEYGIPVNDLQGSVAFWEPLGFVLAEHGDPDEPWAVLTSDCINIGLHAEGRLTRAALTFREPDMGDRIEFLRAKGLSLTHGSPLSQEPESSAVLVSPEGLDLHLLTGDET